MAQLRYSNYREIFVVGLFSISVSLYGCKIKESQVPNQGIEAGNVTVTKPIHRDFDAIKKSGVIRLITRYNSSSYFLHKGVERGFEYEFLSEFAKEHGLSVEVAIIQNGQSAIDMLNSGEGDVIAANYVVTPARKHYVDFTQPYNLVNQVIVLPESWSNKPDSTLADLGDITISVRHNSSYYQTLRHLQSEGYAFKIDTVSEDWDTEALMYGVEQGQFEATVSDDNLFRAANTYIKGITAGPTIEKDDTVAWAIRKNSPELQTAMNKFLAKHFKLRGDQPPKRSEFLNVLRQRYFEDEAQIVALKTPIKTKYAGLLSPYDKLIRPIADSMGIDWRMVVAIAAQESKFDPTAKSWTGAIGLMQISPRFSDYSVHQLMNVRTNIKEGIRILEDQLHHYAYMDSTDQWKFALATYNAGPGHIADARRLVMDQYKNPNEWKNVSRALIMLMKRKYYDDARFGFCRGIETVSYVNDISNRYQMYQTITELAMQTDDKKINPVLGITKTINVP